MATAFGISGREVRHGHGGAGRMLAAWLGWREGLLRLRSIAAALQLRSLGRVSDLVRMAGRARRGDPALQQRLEAGYAELG